MGIQTEAIAQEGNCGFRRAQKFWRRQAVKAVGID